MDSQIPQRDYGFVLGLFTGTLVGAGLAVWLAPGAARELRNRVTDSAERLKSELGEQGNGIRNHVADAVVRSAHEVERYAIDAKRERAPA
jgi:gas vesicle protein